RAEGTPLLRFLECVLGRSGDLASGLLPSWCSPSATTSRGGGVGRSRASILRGVLTGGHGRVCVCQVRADGELPRFFCNVHYTPSILLVLAAYKCDVEYERRTQMWHPVNTPYSR
ncbi:unnamed protein product, partial [Ixodes pacificus]